MHKALRILCVHGLGDKRLSRWKEEWQEALQEAIPTTEGMESDFHFLTYDDIFENVDISAGEAAGAAVKLLRSRFGTLTRRGTKGFYEIPKILKWTAGYVFAWLEDEEFKTASRERVLTAIKEVKPDIVLAHGLGSLITYNTFTHPDSTKSPIPKVMEEMTYVSFGSQIGNPFVVGNLTFGRIVPLKVKEWIHLYNRHDDVFTAPISIWDADNFRQVDTPFNIEGIMDHTGDEYLRHTATTNELWLPLLSEMLQPPKPNGKKTARRGAALCQPTPRSPRKRALLVGINEYRNPGDRLYGCVNDTYLMSSLLQESGFKSEGVRLCLDHRATADGILKRLEWLLDDPRPDDTLVFYYSGHGAQLHTYGEGDEIDRRDETLVPYDFTWSPETSITDDQIYDLYSQLPYNTRFVMIFDCCHSGGIHRAGHPRAKGTDPPDDIRHRGLRWNKENSMWVSRKLPDINKSFWKYRKKLKKYYGADGSSARIGRASALRTFHMDDYQKQKSAAKGVPVGPFLPIIFEACQEDEFAYEYRHGVESYGAFTYAMSKTLRQHIDDGITFNTLLNQTARILKDLGCKQIPKILGPTGLLDTEVPR